MLTQRLTRGDTGPEVRLLQQMLNGLRKAGLTVDGRFGPATEAAVIAAHKAWGIAAPHNVVGPGFRARINADWKAYNTPTTTTTTTRATTTTTTILPTTTTTTTVQIPVPGWNVVLAEADHLASKASDLRDMLRSIDHKE